MHQIAYGFFYLLSLIPFRVIYILSDGVYFLLYYVFKYRKKMVYGHLTVTFPEKSPAEIEKLAKQVYRNFCDVWFEMIKIFSMTKEVAAKRMKCDLTLIEEYYKTGKSVQMIGGHFKNWEYLPVCIPLFQSYSTLAIYMPLKNKTMDKLVFNLRSKFGMVLLKAGNMAKEIQPWMNKQYMMIVGADQSPSNPEATFWLNFCNRPTGFIKGPFIRAARQGQPHVYLYIRKPKRGYYEFKAVPFVDDPSKYSPEEFAFKFVKMLEADIKEAPELYLWTHNRWKKSWKPEYASKWIDKTPSPTAIN
jgi:KDO2-lipid IV(A) lauroyltransferase